MSQETGFEKTRGVSRIEVRNGYASIHIRQLKEPVMEGRLKVLSALADGGISLDFLKLSPAGLSCIVTDSLGAQAQVALKNLAVKFEVQLGRSVVLVHAVNMRDEEGLIAQVVKRAIASGCVIEHISDMHDRMLVVVSENEVEKLKECLVEGLVDVSAGGRR